MSEKEFIDHLSQIGIHLSEEQIQSFAEYANFLLEYNRHTNLTAIKSLNEVYLKHFYDSILGAKFFDFSNKSVLDIGSGAGFPGVPLKICFPSIELTVLDSNGKKTKFLEELKKKLKIDYTVINDRAEKYILTKRESFDVVTSRAVTAMPILSELSIPFVRIGGYFLPYKGKLNEEIEQGEYAMKTLGGTLERVEECTLPYEGSTRTFVFVNKKCKTAEEFPRVFDKINKKPLQKER